MRLHIANGVDGRHGLFVADGRVAAVGHRPDGFEADRRLDAAGLAVLPGLVDLSARVSQAGAAAFAPSELRAALAGGVTCLVLPPDPEAPLDEPGKAEALMRQAQPGQCRVRPLGAMHSRSTHTPFAGMMLPGRVRATVVGGSLAWETPV